MVDSFFQNLMRKKIFISTIAILLTATFCFDATAQTRRPQKRVVRRLVIKRQPTPIEKPASNAVTTASGLTYLITKKGAGRLPKSGETVVVHYTGTLTNGVKFDSSRDRGEPFPFQLGAGRVIKGWDEGIAKLHVGDQAILVIPSALGYGKRGAGGGEIPPDATLIFIVELVEIKNGAAIENP